MVIELSYHMPCANGKKNMENPWEIYGKIYGKPSNDPTIYEKSIGKSMGNAVPKRDCHMDFLETKIYSK